MQNKPIDLLSAPQSGLIDLLSAPQYGLIDTYSAPQSGPIDVLLGKFSTSFQKKLTFLKLKINRYEFLTYIAVISMPKSLTYEKI